MSSSAKRSWLSPSLLARKILCSGYIPAQLNKTDWIRIRGFHAEAMVRVISRHLRMGYQLIDVEKRGPNYRIDLLFRDISGRPRVVEVKSGRIIKEVHRLQGALYSLNEGSEIAVSNAEKDEILTREFVQKATAMADTTLRLIESDPEAARTRHTPHPDVCPLCSNSGCPFLPSREIMA